MGWRGEALGRRWDECDVVGGGGENESDENEVEVDVIVENN